MSNEEKEIIKKEEIQEVLDEVMVEQNDKVNEIREELKKDKPKKGLPNSIKLLLVGLVDQIVVVSISIICLFIFNLILKVFGYEIAELLPMFIIMYLIVNIAYPLFCKVCKFAGSFGTRIVYNE